MGKCISTPDKKKQEPSKVNSKLYKPDQLVLNEGVQKLVTQAQLENLLYDAVLTSQHTLIFDCLSFNYKHQFMVDDQRNFWLESSLFKKLRLREKNQVMIPPQWGEQVHDLPKQFSKLEVLMIKDIGQLNLKERVQNKEQLRIEYQSKKVFQDTHLWNIALIMVAYDLQAPLQTYILTRGLNMTHMKTLFSRPLSEEKQIKTTFCQRKRIKVESFALKLAIFNKSFGMLTFLINGVPTGSGFINCDPDNSIQINDESYPLGEQIANMLSQNWNVGHIIYCIKIIVKTDWVDGLSQLLALRRVKQLICSVSDPGSFLNLINEILFIFFETPKKKSIETTTKLFKPSTEIIDQIFESFDEEPYLLLRTLIGAYTGILNSNELGVNLLKLTRTSFSFFKCELEQIFNEFDSSKIFLSIRNEVLALCNDTGDEDQQSDDQIHYMILELNVALKQLIEDSQYLKQDQDLENEQIDEIIEQLEQIDPYSFKIYNGNIFLKDNEKRESEDDDQKGILGLILSTGDQSLIEYIYSDSSDCNIRQQLIFQNKTEQDIIDNQNMLGDDFMQRESSRFGQQGVGGDSQNILVNRYELFENQMNNQIDVSFFQPLLKMKNLSKFHFVFTYLIEQMNFNSLSNLILLIVQQQQIKPNKQIELIERLIQNLKVASMFQNSLEIDKLDFVKKISSIFADQEYFDPSELSKADYSRIKNIYQSVGYLQKYSSYFSQGTKVQVNQDFHKLTLSYFRQLKQKQESISQNFQANLNWRTPDRDSWLIIELKQQPIKKALKIQPITSNNLTFAEQEMKRQLEEVNRTEEVVKAKKSDRKVLSNVQIPQRSETARGKPSQTLQQAGNYTGRSSLVSDGYRSDGGSQQTLSESQIQVFLEEMEFVVIESDISLAFQELIKNVGKPDCDLSEIAEAITDFKLNVFQSCLVFYPEYQSDKSVEQNQLFSLFLHSVIGNQTQIVQMFLEADEFQDQIDSLILIRPPSTPQELHILQKMTSQADLNSSLSYLKPRQIVIQKIIENRNRQLLPLILEKFCLSFSSHDFIQICQFFQKQKENIWEEGLYEFLLSISTKSAYEHFNPQDKFKFIQELVSPLLGIDQSLKKLINQLCKYDGYLPMLTLSYIDVLYGLGVKDKLQIENITRTDLIIFSTASSLNPSRFRKAVQKAQISDKITQNVLQLLRKVEFSPLEESSFESHEIVNLIQQSENQKCLQKIKKLSDMIKITLKKSDREQYHLFRHQGYQIKSIQEQKQQISFIPVDEDLQDVLYDQYVLDQVKLIAKQRENKQSESERSNAISQIEIEELGKLAREVCLNTLLWNPLIFAIFYGNIEIVKGIFQNAEDQVVTQKNKKDAFLNQITLMLQQPFIMRKIHHETKKSEKLSEFDSFQEEQSSLVSLIICLMTDQPEMLSLLWNHPQLWNNCNYLILLGNYVFETKSINLIRTFLTSQKTASLFQYLSKAEKLKFITFTIDALQKQILDGSQTGSEKDDQGENNQDVGWLIDIRIKTEEQDEEEKEAVRGELEYILNCQFLCTPPFSLVNIPVNLIPLHVNSQVEDLLHIIEQYEEAPDSLQILELAIDNLSGPQEQNLYWQLVCNNEIWARRLFMLIEQLQEQHPSKYIGFTQKVFTKILSPYVKNNS